MTKLVFFETSSSVLQHFDVCFPATPSGRRSPSELSLSLYTFTNTFKNNDGDEDEDQALLLCWCLQDHSENPLGAAVTLAHELGHNFGMNHDTPERGCGCRVTAERGGCIMTPSTG